MLRFLILRSNQRTMEIVMIIMIMTCDISHYSEPTADDYCSVLFFFRFQGLCESHREKETFERDENKLREWGIQKED